MKQYAKGYVSEIKGDDIIAAVASSGSMDRDGDILVPSGWELDNFRKNPVLLWAHDSYSLPIGKATDIGIVGNELKFNAKFAESENEFAGKVAKLMRGGFLNSFSVGFIPKERDEGGRMSKMELLEISVVNVPANAEALNNRDFKAFEEEVKNMKQEPETKSGRILSDKNRKTISTAMDSMMHSYGALKNLMEDVDALEQPEATPVSRSNDEQVKKPAKVEDPKSADLIRALRIADRTIELALKELKNK